jgi:hypothetical protein
MAQHENFTPQQPGDALDAVKQPLGRVFAGLLMGPAMFGGAGRAEGSFATMQQVVNNALTAENTQAIYSSTA